MRRALAPIAIVGVAVLVALAVWSLVAPPVTKVKAGDLAPDFALPHYNQPAARGTLAQVRSSPVVLVFFDSSWPGSALYLVELEKVHRRFLRDGLVVMGVALDPVVEKAALEFLLKNRGVSFTVLEDPGGRVTAPLYGMPRGRAATYVIEAGGRVREVHQEPKRWTGQEQLSSLGALLPKPTPTPHPLDTPTPSG
jgi:peroxiredoxin